MMKRYQVTKDTSIVFTVATLSHLGFNLGIGVWRTDYDTAVLWTICFGPVSVYINRMTPDNFYKEEEVN